MYRRICLAILAFLCLSTALFAASIPQSSLPHVLHIPFAVGQGEELSVTPTGSVTPTITITPKPTFVPTSTPVPPTATPKPTAVPEGTVVAQHMSVVARTRGGQRVRDIVGEVLNNTQTAVYVSNVTISFFNQYNQVIAVASGGPFIRDIGTRQRVPFFIPIPPSAEGYSRFAVDSVTWSPQLGDPPNGLDVVSYDDRPGPTVQGREIYGVVQNNRSRPVFWITIHATVYNASGVVVQEGRVSTSGEVAAGQAVGFTLPIDPWNGGVRYELQATGNSIP